MARAGERLRSWLERLGQRLAGSAGARPGAGPGPVGTAVPARAVQAIPPEADEIAWETPLAAGSLPDRPWHEVRALLEEAARACETNPLAARLIHMTTDFVIGAGATLRVRPAAARRWVQAFWNHPLNRLSERIYAWCDELSRSGELFLVLSRNPVDGMSYVREVPALQIDAIACDPDDLERELRYHQLTADVEGRSEHDLGPLRVSRHPEQFSVSACLIGFEGRGTPLEEVENTLRLLVDGEPALSQDQVIEFDLPAIDGTPDPDDPCTGSMHHFGVWLPMSAVADAGVAMPALGEWTSFELTAVLEIEDPESGHLELESGRTVDIGAGDPFGEFTSATPTPDGVRLGGWIVDPEHAVSVRYRVTVNGRDTAVDEVEPDMVAGQLAGELADGPGPSIWEERELGDAHAIDALVPYGEICVYVLLDEAAPIDEGFVGLGCRTTMSGEVRGGIGGVLGGFGHDILLMSARKSSFSRNSEVWSPPRWVQRRFRPPSTSSVWPVR